MFGEHTVVSFVFILLNFAILIGLGVYFFKRFMVGALKQQMRDEQASLQALVDKKEQLHANKQMLQAQIDAQILETSQLTTKVERWQAVYEQEEQEKYKELAKRKELLIAKVAMQEQLVIAQTVTKKVTPKVLEESKIMLEQQFASAQEGQAFMAKLFMFMERGSV